MRKMNNREIHGFISKCIWNSQLQELIVFFHSDMEGAAFTQSLTFRENGWDGEACKFFKDCPAFTKEGKLDMDWLVGMRVLIRLASTKNGWEIAGGSCDYQYYGMDEEKESGEENGEK